ncbi:hypothetical protein ACIRPH_28335 [Nocardiopsis sp. NPDC101807]|uniref:hypothetical protein n=1 Tax=Nocardiopsis sp. NPDC101807 TaxID=3364339 RepID=UPI00382DDFEE
MPEQRRPLFIPCSGFLALALTAALGNPHVLLAPCTPPTQSAAPAPAEERDTLARRRARGGHDRVRALTRCPRPPKRPLGRVPHPRCHFD